MDYVILLLIVIFGSCLGSFFNVCIYRIPLNKSIVFPASHCPNCSEPIPGWLNIPLLGYLISTGKCRQCGAKIHWHYPVVEFITPLLFILLFLKFGLSILFVKYIILFSFGIILFFTDAFQQIIPDALSLPLIPIGIGLSLLPQTEINILESILSGIFGFVLFYLLAWGYWKLRGKMGLGGGDIKLIAGLGVFVGFSGLLFIILGASIIGLIVILLSGYDLKKQFSFGPFLIVTTIIYVLYGYKVVDLYLNLFNV